MYHIGIMSATIYPESVFEEFKKENIVLTQYKQDGFSSEGLTGLFIEETEEFSIRNICQLVLSLRKKSELFIWVLGKKLKAVDRQIYLQLGVDAVFDQEYFPIEPLLSVVNCLNRYKPEQLQGMENRETTSKAVELNPRNFSMNVLDREGQQREIELTKLEYKALEILNSAPGRAFTYEEMYKKMWKDEVDEKSYRVSNIIFHIRGKLANGSIDPDYIKNVRSKGYMLKL